MEEAKKKNVLGIVSFETRQLADRLSVVTQEEPFLSYDEIGKVIGKNPQGRGRHHLDSARNIVLRERGMLFGTIANEGVKLLDDPERVSTGEGAKGRLRNLARRGIRSVTSVKDFAALPNEYKVKHHAYVTIFRLTEKATRPKAILNIEGEIKDVMRILSAKETLALFSGKRKGNEAGTT